MRARLRVQNGVPSRGTATEGGTLLDRFAELDTPALVIDLPVMEQNVAEMARAADDAGVGLRPHTKTHKSPAIARIQVDAGASGITVAKLGEAEVMVDAGLDDVLIAYPIVGRRKLERLRALAARASVRVSLDSVEVATGIGRVGKDLGTAIPVLVEVDTGLHRMGRASGQASADLAVEIAAVPGVDVIGLLTHAGHAYQAADPHELGTVAEREALDLLETAERCVQVGLDVREISVGSTPTARTVASVPGVTEIRPGTYIFNDVQQLRLGVATTESCAARVLTTVVARPTAERFLLDGGTKAFTSDGGDGPPFPGRGVIVGRPDLILDFMNEEHAVGHVVGDGSLSIGERLEVIPLHVCGCVNMFDIAHGVRDGNVEREIPIAARGRSQ
jgi:D-serine deaminase-like pyridoxal phosphate-dependent protein